MGGGEGARTRSVVTIGWLRRGEKEKGWKRVKDARRDGGEKDCRTKGGTEERRYGGKEDRG